MSKCKYCNSELSASYTVSISNKALIPSDVYHVDLCNDCAKAVVNALQLLERLIPKDSAVNRTADVQSVVRCKDCKHRTEHHYEEEGELPYIKYGCKFTRYSMSDGGFCSFGVRKEEK